MTALEAPARPTTTTPHPDQAQTTQERDVLRAMRRLDWRVGRPRTVVLVWDGRQMLCLDTQQITT